MHDHAPDPTHATRSPPNSQNDPFWERWVPVLVPAGLALVLAFAIVAIILISDPAGTPSLASSSNLDEFFTAQPVDVDTPW